MLQLVPQAVEQSAGPFTFPGAQIIGVGDITQFIVKAAPTQLNNLVEIQANDGSQFVTITGLGETILDVTSTEALLIRKNADGGDVLTVDTNTPKVIIDANLEFTGAQTISTTAGDLTLDAASSVIVYGGASGATANAIADDLVIESDGAGGASILVPNNQTARFAFGNPGDNYAAFISWDYTNTIMKLSTAIAGGQFRIQSGDQVEVMRIVGLRASVGGAITPLATLHIDQATDDEAIPVAIFDQADISEEFIRYIGQSADGVLTQSLVEFGDEASSAGFAWIKVFIVDDNDQLADQAAYVLAYTLSA